MLLHAANDFLFAGAFAFVKRADNSKNHAGCAVAALESSLSQECLLHGMQSVTFCQAFDRRNFFMVHITGQSDAGSDALSVHQHGAGAALTFSTAVFCAGELKFF